MSQEPATDHDVLYSHVCRMWESECANAERISASVRSRVSASLGLAGLISVAALGLDHEAIAPAGNMIWFAAAPAIAGVALLVSGASWIMLGSRSFEPDEELDEDEISRAKKIRPNASYTLEPLSDDVLSALDSFSPCYKAAIGRTWAAATDLRGRNVAERARSNRGKVCLLWGFGCSTFAVCAYILSIGIIVGSGGATKETPSAGSSEQVEEQVGEAEVSEEPDAQDSS